MRTFPCCRWLAFVYVGDRRLRDREGRGYARPGSAPSPDRLRYVWMSASFRSCVHVRCELRGGGGDRLVIACCDAVQGEGIPYSFGSSTCFSPPPFPPFPAGMLPFSFPLSVISSLLFLLLPLYPLLPVLQLSKLPLFCLRQYSIRRSMLGL